MRLFLKKLLSYLPTRLPTGRTQYEAWSNSILDLAGRFADEKSMKASLAQMVIHLPPAKTSKYQTPSGIVPKNHFVQALIKGAANQVASQIYIEIKEEHDAKVKAEQQKQAEATAQLEAVANVKEEITSS